ncbi:MAG: hypothetical protein RL042_105 [Nitrospirota bacterium]|jgi:hypothetical protein
MENTLYILRQHPDSISSSIFQASDEGGDIVFIERASVSVPSSVKGFLVADGGRAGNSTHSPMTYDDLVEKIFSSEHVIVV